MTPTYTLYHGDCLDILPTLAAGSVDAIITDPPYGIDFQSGWTGASISGDKDTFARDRALGIIGNKRMFVFGSPNIAEPAGTKTNLIWHRPGSGMGDLSFPFKPDYEFIHVIGDGLYYPSRGSSVLVFPWDVFRGDALHPHQKPVALIEYLIERISRPGDTILDPFMGSGTTGIACMRTSRNFIGIELDAEYYRIAETRIRNAAGEFVLTDNERERGQLPLWGCG